MRRVDVVVDNEHAMATQIGLQTREPPQQGPLIPWARSRIIARTPKEFIVSPAAIAIPTRRANRTSPHAIMTKRPVGQDFPPVDEQLSTKLGAKRRV
jgi:hypothetical protein